MSIEDLKADLATNMLQAKSLSAMSTVGDIVNHFNLTMWPFFENVLSELDQIEGSVSDLYHEAEDILQPETGALFSAVILGGGGLIIELEKRLTPADAQLAAGIKEWKRLAAEATQVLSEIIIPLDDQEEEVDDEDEEDEEDQDEEEQH